MQNDHFLNNAYFSLWRLKTALLKQVSSPIEHQHLFILSGAASGSTLLHEIISESKNVAIACNRWAREGMRLPVVRNLIFYDGNYSWQRQPEFNWKEIHSELLKYWNPRKSVFLDKGPVYLFQAQSIANEFSNAHFICLHRNPYSLIESYRRKSTLDKDRCIEYAIDSLQQLRLYLESLDSVFSISYTHLTKNPTRAIDELCKWMPELGTINLKKKYSAHNVLKKKIAIRNLDPQKIERLTNDDIQLINNRLSKQDGLMEYFGYEYIYR